MELVYLEAILMDNKELIHKGKSLGFIGTRQSELVESKACKLSHPNMPVVEIKIPGEDNAA